MITARSLLLQFVIGVHPVALVVQVLEPDDPIVEVPGAVPEDLCAEAGGSQVEEKQDFSKQVHFWRGMAAFSLTHSHLRLWSNSVRIMANREASHDTQEEINEVKGERKQGVARKLY